MSEAISQDLHALANPERLARMQRSGRIQRVGWVALAVIVVAGAAGIFGEGPLSRDRISNEGLTLEFDRLIRRATPFTLEVSFTPPAGAQPRLAFARGYFDAVRISSIMPRPAEVVNAPDAVTFVFAAEGTASSLSVQLHYEARDAGLLGGEVRAGSSRLGFTQFVWP